MTDSRGNLYVTGYSGNAQTSPLNPSPMTDIVTINYAPDGIQRWVMRYDGPFHRRDYPSAITVDAGESRSNWLPYFSMLILQSQWNHLFSSP